ncbi:MAG: xanthine dehydrogenase family protein subunit M [Chloroflexota bacterium]
MASYLRPSTLDEALGALAASERVIVAGATDYYPARVGMVPSEDVLDISGIEDLSAISKTDRSWRIPALATWSDVIGAPLPPLFDGLKAAGRTIGGMQIQNRGTVCGNLCNASPAADGIPNLIALDAEVELVSATGSRRLPVQAFVTGNRQTQRRADELVTAIHVPARGARASSAFLKHGARSSLVISIVMVAAVIDLDADGSIEKTAIAVGACSPVARRLPSLEERMRDRRLGPDLAHEVTEADLEPLSPIDDIRGSAAYRRTAALVLVRRVIESLTA